MAENIANQPYDFWNKFSDTTDFDGDFSSYEESCNEPDNLVEAVLDEFNIPHTPIPGTALPNLDIKQMGAAQVIKLSLLHASARDNLFYELTVNEVGEVTYYVLGDVSVSSYIEKYYEMQTQFQIIQQPRHLPSYHVQCCPGMSSITGPFHPTYFHNLG